MWRDEMKKLPEISKEEFLESIREGVKDAILTMTESGDFYLSIKKGVKEGIESIIPGAFEKEDL